MFKIFRHFRKQDWGLTSIVVALIVAQVWLELKIPDYMSEITVLVQTPNSDMMSILQNGGMMLLCALGSLTTAACATYFITRISTGLSRRLRKQFFNKVLSLSSHEIKRFSTSSLITRNTNDISQIQLFINVDMQAMIRAPLSAAIAIAKISTKSWQWSTAVSVAVVIILITAFSLMAVVVPRFKIVQKLIDRINNLTREAITGVRVVRAFNAERYQEERFDKANRRLAKTQLFNHRVLAIVSPMMYLVMYGVTLAVYYIGAHLINEAALDGRLALFSDMIIFSTYATHIIASFIVLSVVFMMAPRAFVSAERINEVLETEPGIHFGTATEGDPAKIGSIEFRHVSFKYPDADDYLLQDISFTAQAGETIAFIGSTGSGKSTLVNLIPRFYDTTEGEILLDGINIREYSQAALYNKLGYVSQRAVLFDNSVKGNVSFGDNGQQKPDAQRVREAIKIAQGQDFVEKMPKQYDAHIAQAGTNISGGQKQRLAIARAIARDPEFYIFDDSFSALDYKTDAKLRQALKKHTKKATSLIVTQRIGTIMDADQIIVLDNGRCVGRGTHRELLRNCNVYKQIALSQLSAEELDV